MFKNVPILNGLINYVNKNTKRYHMPGHKGGNLLFDEFDKKLLSLDVTEISGTDNLSAPAGIIKEAQCLAAKAFGAEHSFFLVGGSTLGILSMITYAAGENDTIIMDRNCHVSAFSALSITGAMPIYVSSETMDTGIPMGLTADKIEKAILENPNAKAVFITSPNCFGITADILNISKVCKKHGVLLLVDEAHGAHFAFHEKLPSTALSQGADMCVQSMHKTLPALTQTAILHISDNKYFDKVSSCIRLYQTTSPSYLLMASMDYAREVMSTYGNELLSNLIYVIKHFAPKNVLYMENKDILRIVILCDGFESAKILENEYNIVPEMAGMSYVVCIVTVSDNPIDVKNLLDIAKNLPPKKANFNLNPPKLESTITPKQAFNAEGEEILLNKAEGRIIKKAVYCYPPGIPIIAPGEIITKEAIDFITSLNGADVHGIENGKVLLVK